MVSSSPSRAVLYVRISELTDATTSPERQREDGQAYAARAGLAVVDTFEDLDLSGTKDLSKRPGLAQAVQAVEEGRADVVIAAKVDRVARSVITFSEVVQRLDAAGGALVSVAEGLDFSTPSGRMVANVLAVFAQFESETIGARVRGAQEHLRREGKWRGGRRPFGWLPAPAPDGKGYVLEHHPEEAPVLLDLVQRVLDGEGIYHLARDLNERGVPTSQGGDAWQYQTVRQVLSKRSLIGDHGAVRLLDDATFARLQATLDSVKPRPERHAQRGLLPSDLVYCGACGAPMRTRSKGKEAAVYVCAAPKPPGRPACWVSAKVAHVDSVVERRALETFSRARLAVRLDPEVVDVAAEERGQIEARLADLEEDRYVRGLFDGPDGADRFARIYGDLRARLEALPPPQAVEGTGTAVPTGEGFPEVWRGAGLHERQDWLRAWLLQVEVLPGKGGRGFDEGRVVLRPHPDEPEA